MPDRLHSTRKTVPAGAVWVGPGSRYGEQWEDYGPLVGYYQMQRRLRTEPDYLEPLRGKNLACRCELTQECFADSLLELANA